MKLSLKDEILVSICVFSTPGLQWLRHRLTDSLSSYINMVLGGGGYIYF